MIRKFIIIFALSLAAATEAQVSTLAGDTNAPEGVAVQPAHFHYEDLPRFFAAYEHFQESGDTRAFESYLQQGSIGLQEYAEQFALTPEQLAETVRKYPKFFQSLDDLETLVRGQEARLSETFAKLGALFPGTSLPDVYFLVGGLRGGGQAGDGNHVMVAADIYAKTPERDTSEFKPGKRMYAPEGMVTIAAHEAAHIIQENTQGTDTYLSLYTDPAKGSILAYALREGVPNLVAKLVAGDHINPEAEAYGLQHEEELWKLFEDEALETDLGDWFFYRPKKHPDWPRDLGYWMGYRIALRCYNGADDKSAMLDRLLKAEDPQALLQECGPPESLAN